jgi:hypothetical protein
MATLAMLSVGCALTDYPVVTPGFNKTHGLPGCISDDRAANSQQTVERATRSLLLTAKDPVTGNTICPGFDPAFTTNTVNQQDARDWERFNAIYQFFGEAQVFGTGPFAGTWALSAVKDLDNGDRRINSYYTPGTGAFSCVGAAINGRYGGPQGVVDGDGYPVNGPTPRIPGWHVETIAIDRSTAITSDFCVNMVASTAFRAAAGYSTYWSFLARAYEGRVVFSPVTRRDGLAEFLNGGSITAQVGEVTVMTHGALNTDGTVRVYLDGLQTETTMYRAENPVYVDVDPSNGGRTIKVYPTDAEARALAQFALDAGLTDREIALPAMVQEFGISLPKATFFLVGDTLRGYLNDGSGGEGGGGFGG